MNTKIIIKCDIGINLGDVGGYHSKDDLERIRDAFIKEGVEKLTAALEGSKNISMSNPKFTIIISDEDIK